MNTVDELNMYGKLLAQPLFQGMSRDDLGHIIMHTKFGFHKYHDGDTIVNDGDACNQLRFLTDGRLLTVTSADDHGYSFIEEFAAPEILQPERIFGLTQRHTRKYRAIGKCNLIALDKEETIRLTDMFVIFRMNLLNIIATQTQRMSRKPWMHLPDNLRQRMVRFFEAHCDKPTGKKLINIKMTRLANELNDNRLNISRELNKMQEEGLLTLRRGVISIPALERLIMTETHRVI